MTTEKEALKEPAVKVQVKEQVKEPPPTKEEVTFQRISDEVVRAHVGNPAKHIGTITKKDGTFFPTIHEFITISQLKEIVAEMEKK